MKTFFVLAACAAGLCGADIVVDDGETVDLSVAGDAVQTELALDLRDTAKLRLDFTGTNEIDRLRLGGVSVSGYVDATHPSGLVCGTGCLYVRPKGTVLLLR